VSPTGPLESQVDLLEIYSAGARVTKEGSNARPQREYGDPAKHVKFAREQCGGCKYERIVVAGKDIGIGICQKKNKDGSKRHYGARCEDFREKGSK
jgi:hypothetical protein